MCPSKVAEGDERGWIVPIGGAEEKEHDPRILKRFVRLCGGRDANIVVIPTASRLEDTGPRYEKIFSDIGAAHVTSLNFSTRAEAAARRLERIARHRVFFTGGSQLRLSASWAAPAPPR